MGNFAFVQVQVVGSAVVRFQDREIFGISYELCFSPGQDREKDGQVGIVAVQQIESLRRFSASFREW